MKQDPARAPQKWTPPHVFMALWNMWTSALMMRAGSVGAPRHDHAASKRGARHAVRPAGSKIRRTLDRTGSVYGRGHIK